MTSSGQGQPSILVLEKCVRVLDCFTPERPKLPIADIRGITGMPATTVARIVRTLADSDLLQRDGDLYQLGLRVLAWTASATAGSQLITAAKPAIAQLRDLTGESAGVYIRRGATRVVVCVELSRQSIICQAHVGQVMPLHSGAAGKVFMAFDPQALTATLEQDSDVPPPSALANRARLEEQLAGVREQGWAFTEEERDPGLNAIAAPVFDTSGTIIAAIALGGPSFRLTREVSKEMGPLVADAAHGLSRRLGGPVDRASPVSDVADAGDAWIR